MERLPFRRGETEQRRDKINEYRQKIVDALQGNTEELKNIPKELFDWNGVCEVLGLYEETSGQDREDMIQAIGSIIEGGNEEPVVIAQVVDLAADLDLAQLEERVKKLEKMPQALNVHVKGAIHNYLAYRELARREPPF